MIPERYLLAGIALLALQTSDAATRYVTDEFEIMLRSGQSTQHGIRRQLKSGTPVEVIGQGRGGYTQVRLSSGVEGWVLSRYLMDTPSGRDRLAALQKKYQQLESGFEQRIAQEKAALQKEIARLEDVAEKPLALQRENNQLKSQLAKQEQRYEMLRAESEILKSPLKDRYWFMTGVLTVIGSIIFGILLTRISWRRRKKWNQL